jgi:hypothetical protein
MRQFKLSQHISNYVDFGEKLHSVGCYGKYKENWIVIHASYLNFWDARKNSIFEEQKSIIDIDTYMT